MVKQSISFIVNDICNYVPMHQYIYAVNKVCNCAADTTTYGGRVSEITGLYSSLPQDVVFRDYVKYG